MTHLKLNKISKAFPGVKALQGVDLDIQPGEIHALAGENGAGKSTLMNCLAGNLQPDEGTILINDKAVSIKNPQEAFSLGISIVYQHLSLTDNLSVAENIFANQLPANNWGLIQYDKLYQQTELFLKQLNLEKINARTLVSRLSPAEKQLVEIAKALSRKPSVLILDEPTASLTDRETQTLFAILKKLKNEGVSIIYISHRLEEIFQLADKISILKDGKYQGTFNRKDLTKDELIRRMVGRDIQLLRTESYCQEDVLLSVDKLTGNRFHDITFQLHRGEILGLAGLVGAGRTEIARALFGADEVISGEVRLLNKMLSAKHPADSISKGIAYVPEERKTLGLFQEMSVQDNMIAGKLENARNGKFYDSTKARRLASDLTTRLRIATPGVQQKVINLSGGNQQKVVLAKWLLTKPDLLIVDEPTHGIDIGARFEIYDILKTLASEGKGILMISSDLPELLGICDRILVIRQGMVAGELSRNEVTEEKILALASS